MSILYGSAPDKEVDLARKVFRTRIDLASTAILSLRYVLLRGCDDDAAGSKNGALARPRKMLTQLFRVRLLAEQRSTQRQRPLSST